MIKVHRGSANSFVIVVGIAVSILVVLAFLLLQLGQSQSSGSDDTDTLLMYCAAGIRLPVQAAVEDYKEEYGVDVQLQFNGSNTLLSQIEVARTGDLYLAADDSYADLAREKDLVRETIPLAKMRPVIIVAKGNPKAIRSIDDLLRDDVITALGNPGQAAVGKMARNLLTQSGHWEQLERHVTETGVFKPTVPEVANDVKLGSADAGIVWDSTVALYDNLEPIRTPELDAGTSEVTICVLKDSRSPTAALRFARYLAARDKGLVAFRDSGFEPADGDQWAEVPEITFFCGAVNRRAVEAVVRAFELREGAVVNTIFNGCGILTAQMNTIHDQQDNQGFPDTYMACDRYYLDSVQDWFQNGVDVSNTAVVIAVPKGNPAKITSLQDLAKPGVRVAVGQPDQCTIGVLTRQVLKAEGVYDEVMKNVVTQTATSAMLVPTVTTRSVDAALAYATDTRAEADKVETVEINSPAAKAVQPFAIARTSRHKQLSQRLFEAIAASRDQFEAAGFHFLLQNR